MSLRDLKMTSLADKLFAERVEERVQKKEQKEAEESKMGKGRKIKKKESENND